MLKIKLSHISKQQKNMGYIFCLDLSIAVNHMHHNIFRFCDTNLYHKKTF